MKKLLVGIISLTLVLSLAACGESKPTTPSTPEPAPSVSTSTEVTPEVSDPEPAPAPDASGDTVGSKYLACFNASSYTDVNDAADELIALNAFDADLVKMDVEPGYLDGFSNEVSGFTKGVKFSPMIGAIPFVGYVFEAENPDEFLAAISDIADPRWNICTEADETVSAVRGNLVFFMMCTNGE